MNRLSDKPRNVRPYGGILTRFIRARRGAVALEFALGLPIFLAMVYGIFEFGRVFWTQNTMEFAVEEAARYAMVNPNAPSGDIVNVVTSKAAGLDVSRISVGIDYETIGASNFVNITGTYKYSPFIPLILPVTKGGSIDFTALEIDIVTTTRMATVQ